MALTTYHYWFECLNNSSEQKKKKKRRDKKKLVNPMRVVNPFISIEYYVWVSIEHPAFNIQSAALISKCISQLISIVVAHTDFVVQSFQ